MIISKIISIAIKKTLKQVVKSKARKAVGKSTLAAMKRQLVKKGGTSKLTRTIDQAQKFIKSADKTGWIIDKIANQHRLTRNMWNEYKRDTRKQWEKIFNEAKLEEYRLEQDMIRRFKKADGLNQLEFRTFREMYKESFNDTQRKWFNSIMGEELQVFFNSTWIDYSVYIPYGKNKKYGIFAIQINGNFKSQRNPFVYYQWVRLERKTYEKIISDPTGTNFWSSWYKDNRYNPRYLTSMSRYNTPEYRKKWREEQRLKKAGK